MVVNNNSGFTQSLWMDIELPEFPKVDKDQNADVCIVGAGIVGLTCAYTLAKQGKSVIVIDKGAIAGGQTARTTAHLSWILEPRYYELESLFGEEDAKKVAQSHAAAIDYIEKITNDEHIECDFERLNGFLFTPLDDSKGELDKELAAIQKTGREAKWIKKAPWTAFETGPCIQVPNQAKFHILKYLAGLTKAILKYGGKIYTNAQADIFEDRSPCIVKTLEGFKITAQSVIVATCTPINNRFFMHTKQSGYRTYVIGAAIPRGSVHNGLYWDTLDPYHYVRTQKNENDPDKEWLIVGGEDHKTGQNNEYDVQYHHLEEWAKFRFPMMGKVEYRWSGQVFESIDSLAFIGRNPENKHIYIATGDCGNGITYGTIAGILLPDLILGKDNPWKDLYEPSRKTLGAVKDFIEENVNSLSQYKDLLTPGGMERLDALKPGEGAILKDGLKKIAAYRDKSGNVHAHSAFCTHLGGCLQWNQGEKSFDCPVHGARFDGCGHVLNGPACHNLKPKT